jgi:hypothetical protein
MYPSPQPPELPVDFEALDPRVQESLSAMGGMNGGGSFGVEQERLAQLAKRINLSLEKTRQRARLQKGLRSTVAGATMQGGGFGMVL